jgi:hypothetical protein
MMIAILLDLPAGGAKETGPAITAGMVTKNFRDFFMF